MVLWNSCNFRFDFTKTSYVFESGAQAKEILFPKPFLCQAREAKMMYSPSPTTVTNRTLRFMGKRQGGVGTRIPNWVWGGGPRPEALIFFLTLGKMWLKTAVAPLKSV